MTRLRNWLGYGNVMATIAVFLAMSGAAVAVTTAPTNSVVSSSIKDGEVRTPDVRTGAVTTTKLRDGAVTSAKVRANSIGSGKVVDGSLSGTDVRNGSLTGADVKDLSLTEDDLGADSVGGNSLAANAVDSSKIANGTIDTEDVHLLDGAVLRPGTVGGNTLMPAAVGSRELHDPTIVVGSGVTINGGTANSTSVDCPPNHQLIAGGYAWRDDEPNSILGSTPNQARNNSWIVRGMPTSGSNVLFAWATCLDE